MRSMIPACVICILCKGVGESRTAVVLLVRGGLCRRGIGLQMLSAQSEECYYQVVYGFAVVVFLWGVCAVAYELV